VLEAHRVGGVSEHFGFEELELVGRAVGEAVGEMVEEFVEFPLPDRVLPGAQHGHRVVL